MTVYTVFTFTWKLYLIISVSTYMNIVEVWRSNANRNNFMGKFQSVPKRSDLNQQFLNAGSFSLVQKQGMMIV
jgi:hypothetical protein